MLLMLIPNPASERFIILITSLAVLGIGGLMFLAAKRTSTAALNQARAIEEAESTSRVIPICREPSPEEGHMPA